MPLPTAVRGKYVLIAGSPATGSYLLLTPRGTGIVYSRPATAELNADLASKGRAPIASDEQAVEIGQDLGLEAARIIIWLDTAPDDLQLTRLDHIAPDGQKMWGFEPGTVPTSTDHPAG